MSKPHHVSNVITSNTTNHRMSSTAAPTSPTNNVTETQVCIWNAHLLRFLFLVVLIFLLEVALHEYYLVSAPSRFLPFISGWVFKNEDAHITSETAYPLRENLLSLMLRILYREIKPAAEDDELQAYAHAMSVGR
jgi:hypothetical protein